MIIAVAIVAAIGYTYFIRQRTNSKVKRIQCTSNLKQISLSFRVWGGDNFGQYPMARPVTNGGTLEVSNLVWRTFQLLSNEIGTPFIVACPSDSRNRAASFASLANSNISYFVGLDADESMSQLLLAGDWCLSGSRPTVNKVLTIQTNDTVTWGGIPHQGQGNVALADGSVQQWSGAALRRGVISALQERTNAPLRLAMPE